VFFGRFISILRTYVAFLAGTLHMKWLRFLAASIAGAIVWSGIYTVASYKAAHTIKRLSGVLDLALGLTAVAVVVIVLLLVRQQVGRLGDKAEAAYPGPLL
jgi:membrane protein DedA with SNARE-associated domain